MNKKLGFIVLLYYNYIMDILSYYSDFDKTLKTLKVKVSNCKYVNSSEWDNSSINKFSLSSLMQVLKIYRQEVNR